MGVRYLAQPRFMVFLVFFTLAGLSEAKRPVSIDLSLGAKLYLAPMDWNLDGFVAAEIRRQGLPVQLVTQVDQADFVMTSLYQPLGSRLISPGHYIQVKIVTANGGKPVWRDEVNDFALFFGRLRPHGPRRAAEVIVRKLRNNLSGVRR